MATRMVKWMISHLSRFALDASKVDFYLYATKREMGPEETQRGRERKKLHEHTESFFFCGDCHINSRIVLVCLTSNVGCAAQSFFTECDLGQWMCVCVWCFIVFQHNKQQQRKKLNFIHATSTQKRKKNDSTDCSSWYITRLCFR